METDTLILNELFPWSSEARILQFLLNDKSLGEESDWQFTSEISAGAKVHNRTVTIKIKKLMKLGFVDDHSSLDTFNRPRKSYRLADTPQVEALSQLADFTEITFKSHLIKAKASDSPVGS